MIKKIKWDNYRSLGNLSLDFTKPDGTIYNTIVLAGDNGTGKTTILDTLSTFLNLGSIVPFESIEYEINGKTFIDYKIDENPDMGFHSRNNPSEGVTSYIRTNKNNRPSKIFEDTQDIRHYGVAYSKAKTGFKTQPITSSQTETLDMEKYDDDSEDDYTQVKQLLVDISAQDNNEWMSLCKNGQGNSPQKFEEFLNKSRLHRFSKAFDGFFENIKFVGIDEGDGIEKKIIFTKYGRIIGVDELSTGEKQIVFRGAHLLKNSRNIDGGMVFIDEPELSMHPNWQKKVLKFYRMLFTENAKQSVQMIIATHSSYVIQEALKDRDNVLVVVLSDINGIIKADNIVAPSVLPIITEAETNYFAFHIPTIDYHIELYGWLQNKHKLSTVKACDDYIEQQSLYDTTIHGKVSSHGRTKYRTLSTYIRNAIDHPDSINRPFTEEQLKTSIELLIKLCK